MSGAPAPPAGDPAAYRRRALAVAAVLGVALALRLAHWAAVRRAPFVAQLVMDSQEYDRWAREIAGGDWLGHGVFFQAPLYPYLLAAVYRLFGHRLDAVYLLQIGFGVAGCYALYRAGRLTAGERAGLAAAALAAVYGPFLFYDVQLLKESLAASVAAFLLWALAAAWCGREAGEEATGDPARGGGATGEGAAADASASPGGSVGGAGAAAGRTAAAAIADARISDGNDGNARGWLLPGVLLGVLALLRENALLVAPLLLPLAWWVEGRGEGARGTASSAGPPGPFRPADPSKRLRALRRTVALAAGVALVLAPVALRNALVGGDLLPTTFQGGTNFYIGNNPQADGTYRPIVPGKQVPELERREPVRIAEERLGRPLSPAEVSRYWLGQGLGWAAAHPGDFLRLLVRKTGLFWSWYEWPDAVDYYQIRRQSPVYRLPLLEFGGVTLLAALGLAWVLRDRARRRPSGLPGPPAGSPAARPPATLGRRYVPPHVFAAGWMASTVVFFLFARYRLPVVPALLLLAALPVAALLPRRKEEGEAPRPSAGELPAAWGWRRVALAVAVAAALVLPRLAGYEPRLDLMHFNLARLAEERGEPEEARREYAATLAVSPRDFLAWLDLGNLAARRRDWPEALRCYRRAAELEPASDDAQSNLGGVYLALGRPEEAAPRLARALELNPRSVQALHNSALLRLRLGDPAGARQLNERTLGVDPANAAALRLRARLAASGGPP